MKTFSSILDFQSYRATAKGTWGFVPTMGALHEGHLSLVRRALEENDNVLVSIFVNPTQFNDPKDLEKYPIRTDEDQRALVAAGATAVMFPTFSQIYPDDYKFKITESSWSQILDGASRPGHFDGVMTVVMKLLNIAGADRAYFGLKDYQQYLLIQKMCEAFFHKTQIIGVETIREKTGLAMSSRNLLLEPSERELAPEFYKILKTAANTNEARELLAQKGFRVDYVEEAQGRRFGAVFLGKVRLIDNLEI